MEESTLTDSSRRQEQAGAHAHEQRDPSSIAKAREALRKATDELLRQQMPEGFWCAELQGDSILESEYILLKWILEEQDDPRLPKIANYLRSIQKPDGSWVQYPGAKLDLAATVKGYFALKLCGDSVDDPHMVRARQCILSLGGAERANSFTKFYLVALGQIHYTAVPSIPPEIVFLPKWFYFHLDKVSAWTRTMITPLMIVSSHKPIRKLPDHLGIEELYVSQTDRHRFMGNEHGHRTWTTIFNSLDKLLKLVDRAGRTPLRRRALKRIEQWLLQHTERSDGLGAIFPAMVYLQIALRCLGYPKDHPKAAQARRQLDELMIEDEPADQIRIQPCFSPVWDTGIAAYALTDAGLDKRHEAMVRCADWLVDKECREPGDWVANVRSPVAPSGWFFEYNNGFYPDVDDTAMVAMALKCIGGRSAVAAGRRGVDWVMAMQNDDGGWAAFDRTEERPILEQVPFADHNAIQDPSCADITGRTLECLGHFDLDVEHPAVRSALGYLRRKQEPEGCWFGRWGVNYVYGTWQALCGIQKVGQDMAAPWVQRAGVWLRSVQLDGGAFGESANSYEDRSLMGQGPATASQTAWGTMGLMTIYGPDDSGVRRGIDWLAQTQLKSGNWDEPWWTGTGFPRVFYLKYHLYPLYFPLMCLGRWLRLSGELD